MRLDYPLHIDFSLGQALSMLTALRQSDSAKVLARDVNKLQGPFTCPRCKRELVIRKGRIKAHHFGHKPPVTCWFGAGETEEHHRAKLAIFDALRSESNVTSAEVEKDFGVAVADVFAIIGGSPVAIEIQRSNLSVNEITRRTSAYYELGVAVLWLGLPSDVPLSDQYSPKAWEKWCHAAYFGRVYYWVDGQTVQPVHLSTYYIEVPASSWYAEGSEQSAGGYERPSKRWRVPVNGNPQLLSRHFASSLRNAWSGGTVLIPKCSLYLDQQRNWWT